MGSNREIIRVFGVTQILILVGIGVAIFLRWKQSKELEQHLKETDLDEKIRLHKKLFAKGGSPAVETDDPLPKDPPVAIESAFPSWSNKTPPEVVLGLPAAATAEQVESAYRKLLKKYHPDRFAHWGEGYQNRAHYIVLLLRQAKDKMRGPKNGD